MSMPNADNVYPLPAPCAGHEMKLREVQVETIAVPFRGTLGSGGWNIYQSLGQEHLSTKREEMRRHHCNEW